MFDLNEGISQRYLGIVGARSLTAHVLDRNALQNMWHLALYFGGLPLGGLLFPALVVYALTLGDYEPHGGLRAAKVKAAQIPAGRLD